MNRKMTGWLIGSMVTASVFFASFSTAMAAEKNVTPSTPHMMQSADAVNSQAANGKNDMAQQCIESMKMMSSGSMPGNNQMGHSAHHAKTINNRQEK
ncbi:Hypothetical protein LUCI_3534 [Lucifera butyrica]|uniref:Pentapeptide MXKDX repeat protein n=2 Tax=Lucifera butyrica TaxID=1351585 RepID=A0A498RDV1_9FIRM|nr:Hypothetical protein LUCI_3534 [Lucifera butyrica]